MRIVVLSAMVLSFALAGERPAAAADASDPAQAKDQKSSAKDQNKAGQGKDQKKVGQGKEQKKDPQSKDARAPGSDGKAANASGKPGDYYEMDSNKLPVGSPRWFEQMEREGRFPRRN
jgi:hypothetical protein